MFKSSFELSLATPSLLTVLLFAMIFGLLFDSKSIKNDKVKTSVRLINNHQDVYEINLSTANCVVGRVLEPINKNKTQFAKKLLSKQDLEQLEIFNDIKMLNWAWAF